MFVFGIWLSSQKRVQSWNHIKILVRKRWAQSYVQKIVNCEIMYQMWSALVNDWTMPLRARAAIHEICTYLLWNLCRLLALRLSNSSWTPSSLPFIGIDSIWNNFRLMSRLCRWHQINYWLCRIRLHSTGLNERTNLCWCLSNYSLSSILSFICSLFFLLYTRLFHVM